VIRTKVLCFSDIGKIDLPLDSLADVIRTNEPELIISLGRLISENPEGIQSFRALISLGLTVLAIPGKSDIELYASIRKHSFLDSMFIRWLDSKATLYGGYLFYGHSHGEFEKSLEYLYSPEQSVWCVPRDSDAPNLDFLGPRGENGLVPKFVVYPEGLLIPRIGEIMIEAPSLEKEKCLLFDFSDLTQKLLRFDAPVR